MCDMFAQGIGAVINKKIIGMTAPTSFVFGSTISWEYSSGFCYSAGTGGVYGVEGSHSETATGFFGYVDPSTNMIVGMASHVCVEH